MGIVFKRGDVAERVGIALGRIEVLRGILRKACDAGSDPVLAGGVDAAKTARQVGAAEVTAGLCIG